MHLRFLSFALILIFVLNNALWAQAPPASNVEALKAELEALIRNGNTPQKLALRCRLLLLAHQGVANQSIAKQLNLSRPTILALRCAFATRC